MDPAASGEGGEPKGGASHLPKALLDAFPDMVFWLDRDGVFLGFKPGFGSEPLFPPAAFLGRKLDACLPGPIAARMHQGLRATLADGAIRVIEYALDYPSGSREFECRLVRVGPDEVAGVVRDLTESRATSQALAEQTLRAQKLEAVERLAAGVAHDFNHLLTLILNYSEFVRGSLAPDHPLLGDLETIARAGERAAHLTRQLMAFSRGPGRTTGPLDLGGLVTDLEEVLRRLLGPEVELVVRIAPGGFMVQADRSQVEQALLNLVMNARDAMPRGGRLAITLQPCPAAGAGDPARARLEIADDGCGMSPQVQEKIFEPFFTTRAAAGRVGMGLAMVHGLVKAMGGTIEVESRPGDGSRFRISVPVLPGVGAAVESPPPLPPLQGGETVLLVDDAPDIRLVASRALARLGFRVLEAADASGAAAVAASHPEPIHLLLTDVCLPGSSGVEVAAQVRALRPGIRVLFTSGVLDERSLPEFPDGLPGAFLPKPFTKATLLRKLQEVLAAPP